MKRLLKPFLAGCFGMTFGLSANAAEPPNIVFIYADDMGYGDVQILNPEQGKIPTPHMDELARQGMIFTDAHTSSSVCTPSRYGLLTGRYNWRTNLQYLVTWGYSPALISDDTLTRWEATAAAGIQYGDDREVASRNENADARREACAHPA